MHKKGKREVKRSFEVTLRVGAGDRSSKYYSLHGEYEDVSPQVRVLCIQLISPYFLPDLKSKFAEADSLSYM